MRRETKQERAAWTEYFGEQVAAPSKYGNERAGKYQSKHEAQVAADLAALERCGKIKHLREQVPITLVEGNGKLRPIKYICDFLWVTPDGQQHIGDAKSAGTKTAVYRLKKRMLKLLLNLEIEEL